MQNEIELKIMLLPQNIPVILNWLAHQNIIEKQTQQLGNSYYDSEDNYFANNKMGLRVRSKNNQHELTLKMAGEIIGGLHIRPEYNLALQNNKPDFKRLVSHYNLQFEDNSILTKTLVPIFSTDFERNQWLVEFQGSQIEIALDQGIIKNQYGTDDICEIEFELTQGKLTDLLDLLIQMPKQNGMWLSSLSKAQRGYLIGNTEKIAKEIQDLTACHIETLNEISKYQILQQLADFIRLTNHTDLIKKYQLITQNNIENIDYLYSKSYLNDNIQILKHYYS